MRTVQYYCCVREQCRATVMPHYYALIYIFSLFFSLLSRVFYWTKSDNSTLIPEKRKKFRTTYLLGVISRRSSRKRKRLYYKDTVY